MRMLKRVSYILILFVASCSSGEKTNSEIEPLSAPVRTARVQREERTIEVAGTVRATDVALLASRFGGFVRSVPVRAGMRVKKGDLLVLLDDRSFSAQREKLLAAKREADKSVEAAQAQERLATSTFERTRRLYESKAASRQEFEEAQSRKESSKAAYDAAVEHVSQTESDIRDLRASLDYLRILAPFDAVVTGVSIDVGTFVNAGQPVVTLENSSAYQVLFSVEEDLLKIVQQDQQIAVSIPSISTHKFKAVVEEVNSAADVSTRTFSVKANLPANPAIRSGLSARIFLPGSSGKTLWIPEEFLEKKDDIETVLVKEQNRWRRILVKSGTHKDGHIEILAGLNEGDLVGLTEEIR
ncbi:efflux RND transporter periplasmic adaptor subunit [bacterium]|nr:efflux RND transporter periplasmic adaptor subunit [bacterium]